jgi:hypothetical protein
LNSGAPTDEGQFDVAVETAPKSDVVAVEEDEESKRRRDAELASTFDQTLAHNGKTEEELIEERQEETRQLLDTAIAVGVIVAIAENAEQDGADLDVEQAVEIDGDDDDGGD